MTWYHGDITGWSWNKWYTRARRRWGNCTTHLIQICNSFSVSDTFIANNQIYLQGKSGYKGEQASDGDKRWLIILENAVPSPYGHELGNLSAGRTGRVRHSGNQRRQGTTTWIRNDHLYMIIGNIDVSFVTMWPVAGSWGFDWWKRT